MQNKGIYYTIEFFSIIVIVFFLLNKFLYIENKSKIETRKITNEFLIRQKDFYTKIEELNKDKEEYEEQQLEENHEREVKKIDNNIKKEKTKNNNKENLVDSLIEQTLKNETK